MAKQYAVYTASMGMMDWLYLPGGGGYENVDFICYSDDPEIWPEGCKDPTQPWQIRHVERKWKGSNNDRKEAKYYKLHSHLLLPEYEATLWLDTRLCLRGLRKGFKNLKKDLALRRHPSRGCLYQEAAVCTKGGKDHPVRIAKQVGKYVEAGIKQKAGLWMGGIIFRKNTPAIAAFNELWWQEILDHSIRDQISLPYVLRETGIDFQTLARNVPNLQGHGHHRRSANAKTNALQRKN